MILFPRFNTAVTYTLEYYGISRIKGYMEKFAGGLNSGYLDQWEGIILGLHAYMQEEIEQTIHTTTHNTQVFLFDELLRSWLTDIRMSGLNKELILEEIEKYNNKTYQDFLLKVEDSVLKFQSNPNYQRDHLEEYEEDQPFLAMVMPGVPYGKFKSKKTNYKYYCIQDRPDLIDISNVDQYFALVKKLVDNFHSIIKRYVERYDAGKIFANLSLPAQSPLLNLPIDEENRQLLPAPPEKLELNLTVQQLAFFFKLLYEAKPDIIKSKMTKIQLARFISKHFITPGKKGASISENKLENLLSNDGTAKRDANYWVRILKEMLTMAQKV